MRKERWKKVRARLLVAAAIPLAIGSVVPARAQDSGFSATAGSGGTVQLWVDQKSGQVFVRPGKGRSLVNFPVSAAPGGVTRHTEEEISERVEEKTKADFQQQMSTLETKNAELSKQVATMQPAWKDFVDRWDKKLSIG